MHSNFEDGILLINKEKNKTSSQVIIELRKILNIKKIGHSGTLDKNATGLLIVGIGKATRLLKYFIKLPKTYIAEIFFGIQTNTDDANGNQIKSYIGKIKLDNIKNHLTFFKGKIKQIPPDYSAVHVNGKRSYKLAMNNQKPKLKERIINISKLKIISFKNPMLKLEIDCSSGTYIRSIARDLGMQTGYFAHLFSLKRKNIDNFKLKNAYTLKNIKSNNFKMISAYNALEKFTSIKIDKKYIKDIKNGKKINIEWFKNKNSFSKNNEELYKIHNNKKLLAIIKIINGNFKYDLVY
jgi:tRNA pseudouridine55 synthase